jgi:hypothetical protein
MIKIIIFLFLCIVNTIYAQTATEWFEKGMATQDNAKAIEYFTKAIANKYFPLENEHYE